MEHSNALQIVRTDALNGVESIMATIATAASSSVRLQNQLAGSRCPSEDLVLISARKKPKSERIES